MPQSRNPKLLKRSGRVRAGGYDIGDVPSSVIRENFLTIRPYGRRYSAARITYLFIDPASRDLFIEAGTRRRATPTFPRIRPFPSFWGHRLSKKVAGAAQWHPDKGRKVIVVAYMTSKPEWRRLGVNTLLMDYLARMHPGYTIQFHDLTDEGRAFMEGSGMGEELIQNPSDEKLRRLERLAEAGDAHAVARDARESHRRGVDHPHEFGSDTGIDFSHGTPVNLDVETGIRYGIISQHYLGDDIWDIVESIYYPRCPDCGEDLSELDEIPNECPVCGEELDPDYLTGDEPDVMLVDYEGVGGNISGGNLWVITSPYYMRGTHCSPCAPGAVSIGSPTPGGPRAYCPPHDWYHEGRAPFTIFLVEDNTILPPPTRENPDERTRALERRAEAGDTDARRRLSGMLMRTRLSSPEDLRRMATSGRDVDRMRLCLAAALNYRPAVNAALGRHVEGHTSIGMFSPYPSEYPDAVCDLRLLHAAVNKGGRPGFEGSWINRITTDESRNTYIALSMGYSVRALIGLVVSVEDYLSDGDVSEITQLVDRVRVWLDMPPEEAGEEGEAIAEQYIDSISAFDPSGVLYPGPRPGDDYPTHKRVRLHLCPYDVAMQLVLTVGMMSGSRLVGWGYGWPHTRLERGWSSAIRYLRTVFEHEDIPPFILRSVHREVIPWLFAPGARRNPEVRPGERR